MKIVKRKINELIRAEYNPRKLTKVQEQDLKDSLTRFGLVDPVLININSERENIIIGGHQRLKVWESLGNTDVDCIELDLSYEKERELNVRLNKNTGGWDDELLMNYFDYEELTEWGFTTDELFEKEETTLDGLIDDDEVPEPKESKVKRGDIWKLGEHRIMCGDSTSSDDVEKLMNGEKADMVFTDPPYGVSYTGGLKDGNNGLENNNRQMIKNDDVDLYYQAVAIANNFSNGVVFMFYADTVPFGLYRGIEDVKGEIVALIIWKKKGGYGALGAAYKPNHEPCIIWKPKGTKTNFIGSTTETRVWEIDKDGKNKLHPTQKPIEVSLRAIKNHKADIVLDMFLGSGSTLIAAEKLNRKCYGMELDEKYCDVIIERWEQFTGQKAIKTNG